MKKTILMTAASAAMTILMSGAFAGDYQATNNGFINGQYLVPVHKPVNNGVVTVNALHIVQLKVTDNWLDANEFVGAQAFIVSKESETITLSANKNCGSCHSKNSVQFRAAAQQNPPPGDQVFVMSAAILRASLAPG